MEENNIYDAKATQRQEFEVTENGAKYDTAHVYQPLDDPRYLEFVKSFKLKGDGKEINENETEAYTTLWDDLCTEVENFDAEGEENWKSLIDSSEKTESLINFLAVAVVEPETKSDGKRRAAAITTETIITEAFFNYPNTCQQTHVLKKKTDDWKKKYDHIKRKQWRQEATKGLRREPKIEYVPQNEAFGALYDEMFISSEGFKDNVTPLRFKTTVIHHIFGGSKLDEKK